VEFLESGENIEPLINEAARYSAWLPSRHRRLLRHAPMESFWGSMQIELLNRQNSALDYLTPNEFEDLHLTEPQATLA
jgi:hypothetical protein